MVTLFHFPVPIPLVLCIHVRNTVLLEPCLGETRFSGLEGLHTGVKYNPFPSNSTVV